MFIRDKAGGRNKRQGYTKEEGAKRRKLFTKNELWKKCTCGKSPVKVKILKKSLLVPWHPLFVKQVVADTYPVALSQRSANYGA